MDDPRDDMPATTTEEWEEAMGVGKYDRPDPPDTTCPGCGGKVSGEDLGCTNDACPDPFTFEQSK
jgi:hypothetical protein